MTTLDPDAIERREIEARRKADYKGDWVQLIDFIAWAKAGVPALCDDIKALREALAERDADYRKRIAAWQADAEAQAERVRELEARLIGIAAECHGAKWQFEEDRTGAFEVLHRIGDRSRQEAKPHDPR